MTRRCGLMFFAGHPPYYWTHGTTRPLRRLDFIFYGHDSVFFERESEGSVWVARSSF